MQGQVLGPPGCQQRAPADGATGSHLRAGLRPGFLTGAIEGSWDHSDVNRDAGRSPDEGNHWFSTSSTAR